MYDFILRFIFVILQIPLFNNKYQKWVKGQKNIFNQIKKKSTKRIWFHCASIGEYENIKPLILKLKTGRNKIFVSFFSQSALSQFKDYDLVDQTSFLPLDTENNMKIFIDLINPKLVIISKNEIWPNMIQSINKKKIPIFSVGLKLKKSKIKRFLNRKFYTKHLNSFSYIFCQDIDTYNFLIKNNIYQCMLMFDLRIEQIINDKLRSSKNHIISSFIQNKTTIVYGSLEKNDFEKITKFIKDRNDLKHIVVPHEIKSSQINYLIKKIGNNYCYYSKISTENIPIHKSILIVDVFGLLKHLYNYSSISYVGGGFDKGVHNTIEPAIYGNFLIFGPKHQDFKETNYFIKNDVAEVVKNKSEFEKVISMLLVKKNSNSENIKKISSFIKNNNNTSNIIIDKICEICEI
ncbi:MAG: hypothetical protein CMP65_05045 [Flavobacteriales bacterium]|nr:hypothetical protein [Flavobacteriales bacterium]